MEVEITIPEKCQVLFSNYRYCCLWGGRGSSKSWSAIRYLLVRALEKKCRILCTREIQRSIRDSIHRLISDQIQLLGLGEYFEITRDEIRCIPTGSHFLFAGLASNTVESIKSYENVNYCMVEEAQCVSERSWSVLLPTIRAEGSQIIICMNPELETDPTYIRFIKNASRTPGCVSVNINYDSNPHFSETLRREMEYCKQEDYDAYTNIWLGACKSHSDASVFRNKYSSQEFTPKSHWNGPYWGVDWGYATDPTAMIKCWIDETSNTLYIEAEAWEQHTEVQMLPTLFDGVCNMEGRKFVCRADNARPELISHCKRNGYPKMIPCKKWKGREEDGIDFIRGFNEIVIHSDCSHTLEEFRNISYKVDKLSGDVLPELMGTWNHLIDALAYSLEPLILGHKQKIAARPEPPQYDSLGRQIVKIPGIRDPLAPYMNKDAWLA